MAQYYPRAVRSTRIGCASAVGRVGALFGPIIIGVLWGMELPHKLNFLAVAIPAVIGAIAVALIRIQKASEPVTETPPVVSKASRS